MYKLVTSNTDIIYNSNSLSWSSDTDTLGTQLTFESIKNLLEGAVVSLFNDSKELIRGVIIKKTENKNTWSYVVQDYSFYLKNKILIQFNGINASSGISSILNQAYIQGDIVEIPTLITQIYKNKTLSEIIDDILEQSKKDQGIEYFKEIEANILYIRKLQDMKINPKFYISKDFNIESSIENMKNKIQIVSNGESNNSIIASAEDTSKQYWYGVLSDMQEVEEKDIAQAQNIANNLLEESNKIERSTSIPIVAFDRADDIKANRLIYLNAGSKLCGYYKIKSASHTLEKNLHKVNLSIDWKVKA